MIAAIILIAAALTWLLFETDFMRIRLESTEYQRTKLTKFNTDLIREDGIKARETELPENTTPYKPSEFTPLEIPELNGKLNIVCQIE